MNTASQSWKNSALESVAVLARWFLGAMFIFMGMGKAMDPVGFLKLLREYDMIHNPLLLNSVASALPWFEVFCGALLMAGVAVRGGALMLLLMLVPFTFIVLWRALQLQGALHIPFCAVKFDCGCGAGEVLICRKLVENGMLICLSVWLLVGRGRRFCAWYGLKSGAGKKLAAEG